MNHNVEEIRARKEVSVTRIEEVDDVEPEKSEEEEEEEEFGERKNTRKHDLPQPDDQERIEHEMTHLPFRSWCRHYIKGRWREEDCRQATAEERERQQSSLVARERSTGERIGRRLMSWMREIELEFVDITVTHREQLLEVRRATGLLRERFNLYRE